MKVLVIGSGAREHALCWKIRQSRKKIDLFCAPGSPGIAKLATLVPISATDVQQLLDYALKEEMDLTVVGPEAPLELGIVDAFESRELAIFGPTRAAAMLETSKSFAKKIMQEAGVPMPFYQEFSDAAAATEWAKKMKGKMVVKADGLAAGKGVTVCETEEEAIKAIHEAMTYRKFGSAGNKIVIEEFLEGEEVSLLAFCDGKTAKPMPLAQDHKKAFDFDEGPNTGGMGAYAPVPFISRQLEKKVFQQTIQSVVSLMHKKGTPFKGILYAGLMVNGNEARVLEYNARFGDPETEVLMPLLKSDLVDILLACCRQKLASTTVEFRPQSAACVVAASKGYPGPHETGHPIHGMGSVCAPDTVVFHAGTQEKEGNLVSSGGRVLVVSAMDKTLSLALAKTYTALASIQFNGMHYRKDIGQRAFKKELSDKKTKIREEKRKKRSALTNSQRKQKSAEIVERLLQTPEFKKAKNIMAYMNYSSEVETPAIIQQALKQKKKVFVPFVDPKTHHIHPTPVSAATRYTKDFLGIPVPVSPLPTDPKKMDLVIVAGIAFDESGHRIGHGRGLYDKFLKTVSPKCHKIALAFEVQLTPEVPGEPHDVRMDKIITEKREILPQKTKEIIK
ncbi:MAG: phosphoribosylamine--glycine ligase [Candidatus Diapherotrites archaeon]|nr:phosphoribosylamine--glycine ligase [Candidatus Diapherotrites archaeon]